MINQFQVYTNQLTAASNANLFQWAQFSQSISQHLPPSYMLPPSACVAPSSKPSLLPNIEWLRSRVDEIRIKL